MSDDNSILLGAVAYDPKVVTIWEGIREHFQNEGVALDFALFSNYERQVAQLLRVTSTSPGTRHWRMCRLSSVPVVSPYLSECVTAIETFTPR